MLSYYIIILKVFLNPYIFNKKNKIRKIKNKTYFYFYFIKLYICYKHFDI